MAHQTLSKNEFDALINPFISSNDLDYKTLYQINLIKRLKGNPLLLKNRQNFSTAFNNLWDLYKSYSVTEKKSKIQFKNLLDNLHKESEVSNLDAERIVEILLEVSKFNV